MTLDDARLCLVAVKLAQAYQVGTGYQVTGDKVLTAAHLLRERQGGLLVRFLGEGEWLPVEVIWTTAEKSDLDAALLRLTTPRPARGSLRWGRLATTRVASWIGAGFPGASVVETRDGAEVREIAGVHGSLNPHGGKVQGLIELVPEGCPAKPDDWCGLSGGPAMMHGHLVGVMKASLFGGARLWASPVSALLDDDAFREEVGAPEPRLLFATGPVSNLLDENRVPLGELHNPARLLNARHEVVPFWDPGRTEELALLDRFRDGSEGTAVLLLTGSGGVGKTRLLVQYTKGLREKGWAAGFLPTAGSYDEDGQRALIRELVEHASVPGLLVVDYAEAQPGLPDLLRWLARRDGGHPLRVVLLAREAAEWWSVLRADSRVAGLLDRHRPHRFAPLRIGEQERTAFYLHAAERYATLLGGHPAPPPDLAGEIFGRPLYVQMAALVPLLDGARPPTRDLLSEILDHEEQYWTEAIQRDEEFLRRARQCMAALTLRGGAAGPAEAEQINRAAGGPERDREEWLKLLHRVYPGGAGTPGLERFLGPLEPDLLGEALVRRVLMGPRDTARLPGARARGRVPGRERHRVDTARTSR